MACLGGNEQLVAMGVERLLHVLSETLFGGSVGWSIVVGEIEMANAMVEGIVHDLESATLVVVFTKVVPETQRDLG